MRGRDPGSIGAENRPADTPAPSTNQAELSDLPDLSDLSELPDALTERVDAVSWQKEKENQRVGALSSIDYLCVVNNEAVTQRHTHTHVGCAVFYRLRFVVVVLFS